MLWENENGDKMKKHGDKMKKQAILLVTTVVFTLLLCGAVSAEDSQGVGGVENITNSSNEIDPEITLNINLEHPEALSGNKLPNITVTDTDGNTINGITVTKSGNNQYKVNFFSDKNSFNLTVSALGHVNQTVTVPVSQKTLTDPMLYGNASVSLRAYNMMIIGSSDTYAKSFAESYKELRSQGYYYNLHYFTSSQFLSNDSLIKELIKNAASKADLIIVHYVSSPDRVAKIKEFIAENNAIKILAVNSAGSFDDDPRFETDDTHTFKYWKGGSKENLRRFQLYVMSSIGMKLKDGEDLSVITWPSKFIYHPDANVALFTTLDDYFSWYKTRNSFNENAPWVGVVAQDSSFKNDNHEIHTALLRSLESKGFNVILTFGNASGREDIIDKYFKVGNKTIIEALISCTGFRYLSDGDLAVEQFESLNVPVFAPPYSSDLQKWLETSGGLLSEQWWQVAQPEMSGMIEPIIMGGKDYEEIDNETGIPIVRFKPITDRIEKITERVANWIELRKLDNIDKKIALLYYNIGGGKDGVSASYLNVVASVENILVSLKEDGYDIPVDYSADDIVNLMLTSGNNVGSWAQGELEKVVQAGALTIPVSDYMAWFENLPHELQQEILAEWGPAPGNVMIYGDQIVIPGIMLGNIFLGPQPMRGWGEDPEKIKHSLTLPPHHQYIAFYLWLQNHFNAVIHLGTHGTLEWLPGRSLGLGEDDWPDVLIGNLPNINPYFLENPGEGTQAKRRGYAVIIDHMIPPMIPSELHGELADLNDLINSYHSAADPLRKEVLKNQTIDLIKKLNIHIDLNLDLENTPFEDVAHEVQHYLEDLAEQTIPYGLHTFGIPLSGELLDQMIETIVSFDPGKRDNPEYREMIRQKLSQNYEMENLLAALKGEFISPAPSGSPIRKPDVLPTGMNFYSFDPRSAPDPAAWEIGKKMADDLIESFYNEKGYYPDSMGVVLWATETMRTNGQSIAMILRLMGAEPVWSSGRFNNVKITPLNQLGRPRIDVVVSISGLFRDAFSHTITMLDDAFQKVAVLNESSADNFVRKHYLEDLENYLNQGLYPDEANNIAIARIFGPSAESYGTGVSNLVTTTSGWEDQSELVETYLRRMSYYYGRDSFAVGGIDPFKNHLKRIDATVQVRDGIYGILDSDDVVQFLGSLSMAAQSVSGKEVSIYLANSRTNNVKIESLSTFLNTELRSRVLNPKWAEGMLNNGFSGANTISKHVEHLFVWNAVSPESVKDWMWDQVIETYVFNSDMRNQLLQANPHAFKSIAAWGIEVARRGMWVPDSATLSQLKDLYIKANVEYGVTCCHHTCGNIAFTNYVVMGTSLNVDQLKQFAAIMESATGKAVTVGTTGNPSQPTSSASTSSGASSSPGSSSAGNQPTTESSSQSSSESAPSESGEDSSKSYEVSEKGSSSTSQSSVPLMAIVGVLILVGLVGFGYFRGAIFKK